MPNEEHLSLLLKGTEAWNEWRAENPFIKPNLSGADLRYVDLYGAKLSSVDLSGANLSGADLRDTDLFEAELFDANLSEANLSRADFSSQNFSGTNLSGAILSGANLALANLSRADLSAAKLDGANLGWTNLTSANLREAHLAWADLTSARLIGTDLTSANLRCANLVEAELTEADLTGCYIYGVSAWELKITDTKQENLIITKFGETEISVDNIEVAQFIYLLIHNQKIRDVIDTIGKKAVLILGRFTPERKAVLDALRDQLRKREYLPILFDFDKPTSKDLTGTVLTLAHMARFIIADLTDPSCSPYEVAKVADAFVPVQPIVLSGNREFAMFADLQRRHHWFLPIYSYQSQEQLITELSERVIRPAEDKVLELRG